MDVERNLRLHWFCFTSLRDWFRKLAPLSQSIRCKMKAITTCTFSRALGRLVVFTLGSHWLLPVLYFHLIGCCDNTGVGFTTLNRKALYLVDGAGFLQQSRKAVRQTTANRNYCKPSIETLTISLPTMFDSYTLSCP